MPDFNFQCWNCHESFSKVHDNGLCFDCNRAKKCRKCGTACLGISAKEGLCWSCSGKQPADFKLSAAGEDEPGEGAEVIE